MGVRACVHACTFEPIPVPTSPCDMIRSPGVNTTSRSPPAISRIASRCRPRNRPTRWSVRIIVVGSTVADVVVVVFVVAAVAGVMVLSPACVVDDAVANVAGGGVRSVCCSAALCPSPPAPSPSPTCNGANGLSMVWCKPEEGEEEAEEEGESAESERCEALSACVCRCCRCCCCCCWWWW